MFRKKTILIAMIFAMSALIFVPSDVKAGPLLDWWLGRRARRTQPWTLQSRFGRNAAAMEQSANGCLQPGVCKVDCYRTCQRTVVNYVPQTCYRTQWQRIPVTQYRPVTNSDPNTGCTVTCMRPCTSYKWQMQRVPYTTYRPVYRNESYRVPVTYYTNDCGSANASCGSCNSSPNVSGPAFSDGQPTPAIPPAGGVNTSGNYIGQPNYYNAGQSNISSGADSIPMIDPTSTQRPIIRQTLPPDTSRLQDVPNLPSSPMNFSSPPDVSPLQAPDNNLEIESVPSLIGNSDDKQANALIRERWNYTPVRLASYQTSTESTTPRRASSANVYQGQLRVVQPPAHPNSIWQAK